VVEGGGRRRKERLIVLFKMARVCEILLRFFPAAAVCVRDPVSYFAVINSSRSSRSLEKKKKKKKGVEH